MAHCPLPVPRRSTKIETLWTRDIPVLLRLLAIMCRLAPQAVEIEVGQSQHGMLKPISQARFLLFSGDGMTPSRAWTLYSGEKRHGLSFAHSLAVEFAAPAALPRA